MPSFSVREGVVIASRTCVICGATGAELMPVTFRTDPARALSILGGVLGLLAQAQRKDRTIDLPLHAACLSRWERAAVIVHVAAVLAALLIILGSAFIFLNARAAWALGAGLAVLGVPLYFRFVRRSLRCVEIRPDTTILWTPSEAAATALGGGMSKQAVVAATEKLENKPVPVGARCGKHGGTTATFACAKCGFVGWRDCEFRVGSPSVLVCGPCLRRSTEPA